ncbi:uncharacterized protein EMH_0072410 [Eimeria mitis]|uniref:Uncharacterized protein n=1 Tax=Eimeria mitis TaxID=44415 RepID=U6KLC5_9EIME|nr:uncharacterized protein EMH_0072410 [Eimeria mitis]CDJ36258.1 hypothetical protein EMH_0072410 [Eimeria mitis]
MNEAAGIQSGLQAPQALQKQEQLDPMPVLVGSPLSSAQERAQGELDAAAALLSLIGSQYAPGHFASGARQSTSSEVLQQRRRTRRMEQKVQRERSSMQRQLLRLKQQIKSERRLRQQLQAQMQKARKHQAHQQPRQQQQQQQQQQQYLPQQQAHSPQRPLHQPQPPPLLQHDQEKRQRLMQQQEQHVMPVEEGTRQHTQRKRRREQQGELQPREEEQHQSWQHGNQIPGHLMEDEWLEQENSIVHAPQPSTSQQALQHSTAGAAARRSTSEDRSTQVIPLELADNAATSASASDGSSRDSADIAPAAGPAAGAAVASAGDARELQAAVSSADESPTQGASMNIEMRTVLGLHTHGSADSTGAAAAGTAATAAASSAIAASSSTSASSTLLEERASDPDAELARVTAGMIEYAVNHHRLDLTHFQPSRALDRMGMRFLLMDAVVSAFIVLGQTPRARDWKIFTDSIGHGHPAGYFLGRRPGRVTSGSFLGRDLSRAIQMLKAGIRPAPADLVNLKRALICSPSSPARFRKPDFDRWREDDVSPTPGQ